MGIEDLTDEEAEAFYRVVTGRDDEERMLLAGAKSYATDTYRGARDIAGVDVSVWELLHDSDRAACLHKARVVLRGAGVIR